MQNENIEIESKNRNGVSFPVEIFLSKKKLLFLHISTLSFAALFYLVIFTEPEKLPGTFIILSLIGIPLCILIFIFGILKSLKKRRGIIIDEKGIWYRINNDRDQIVPWVHIDCFEFNKGGPLNKAINIFVHEPESYVRGSGFTAWWQESRLKNVGTPLYIPISLYAEKPADILEVLNTCKELAGNIKPSTINSVEEKTKKIEAKLEKMISLRKKV